MNFPTITLKTGVRIMTRPVLSEELPPEFQQDQPPGQPAVHLNFNECCDIAATLKGRLPTEAEWLEAFAAKPYNGGIAEWTTTHENANVIVRSGSWGSSWINSTEGCHVALSDAERPVVRCKIVGFRLAFDP